MIQFAKDSRRWIFIGFLAWMLSMLSPLRATTLTATLSANGDYKAYLSTSASNPGSLFLDSSQLADSPGVGEVELEAGVLHYLHIEVKAGTGDTPNLIGTVTLNDFGFAFPNINTTLSTNAENWTASDESFDGNLDFLVDLGPNGTSPWGSKEGVDSDARYIWSASDAGQLYFTVPIIPVIPVANDFAVTVRPDFLGTGALEDSSTLPTQKTYLEGDRKAIAVADYGRVAIRSEEPLLNASGNLYLQTSADTTLYDFVITSSGDETTVDASLNLQLRGRMKGGAGIGGLPYEISSSSTDLLANAQVGNDPLYFGGLTISAWHEAGTDHPGTGLNKIENGNFVGIFPSNVSGDAGDFLNEYDLEIDQVFTTPVYELPVGTPFKVRLSLVATSSTQSDEGRALSIMNFSGGWSLPVSGNVFNLPEGFTVNSTFGNVLDNHVKGSAQTDAPFAEGMFLHLPDAEGESHAEGHEGWIDLKSISSSVSRSRGGYRSIPPLLGDIVVTKPVDKSSPKLAQALGDGTQFDDVVIEYNQALSDGSGTDQYSSFQYRLSGAIINQYGFSNRPKDPIPTEEVSLNYDYVDWIHRQLSDTGVSQNEVNAWWDVPTAQGGAGSKTSDNNPPATDPVGNQTVAPGATGTVDIDISDPETPASELLTSVSTNRPDLIGGLAVTGDGAHRQISYKTSALRSGVAAIHLTVSDGVDTRTTSIPILIDVEMTPFEGFLAAYFTSEEMNNPKIASPILDPDNDGILTITEYLLGTNPTEYNKASEAIKVAFTSDGGECHYTLDFKKRLDDPNIQGYFWISNNLTDWIRMDDSKPQYEETTLESPNSHYEETKATIAFPDACLDPKFIRFQVQNVF